MEFHFLIALKEEADWADFVNLRGEPIVEDLVILLQLLLLEQSLMNSFKGGGSQHNA